MYRKLKLVPRIMVGSLRESITEQENQLPFIAGCAFAWVLAAFTLVPLMVYGSGGDVKAYVATALIIVPIAAASAVCVGLLLARRILDSDEWAQVWNELEAEYGGS